MSTLRRKRTPFSNNRKKIDPQKELDEDLLAIETVDAASCWRIYRLEDNACKLHIPPQPKSKNCKQNPYCIHRIGFEKFEKIYQSVQEGKPMAEIIVRRNPEEQPCGLVNTGNYCYLNSFLQIWFNDVHFRQCIFDWRPHLEWVKPAGAKLDIQEVLNCLQRLFITLQNTPFDSTNPTEFINLLRLDNEQQDVQEFHTLFFDTLERNLELHPNGEQIRATLNDLFLSRLRQTTYCRNCGNESRAFCEYRSLLLSIDGINSLDAAIDKFFEPESLSDFKCKCGKTGATHKLMEFEMLPQVLIIQLIRYVYDSVKEQHKKLRAPISYPRALKARKLKQDANNDLEYELTAVMIHEGPNSHCGHYYDIIRDPLTNRWFTYNDKRVVPEKRQPGYEANKMPKETPRATNDQKGCYALIYQRGQLPAKNEAKVRFRMPEGDVVNEVCKKLEDDFAREDKEGNRSNQLWEHRIRQRHAYLNKLINELEVDKGRSFLNRPNEIVFLPTSLLADLFAKEHEAVANMQTIGDKMLQQQPKENGEKGGEEEGQGNEDANQPEQSQNFLSLHEDVYAPEPLGDVDLALCKHDNLPLTALLKGELKAVQKLGAQRIISEFNVRLNFLGFDEVKKEAVIENGGTNDENGDQPCTSASLAKSPVKKEENGSNQTMEGNGKNPPQNRFLTGEDLCWECVRELKNQANCRHNLLETENQLAEALKNLAKRTHDPNRSNPLPSIDPPSKAVWVSVEHLKKFKKIALDQMENANDMNTDDDDEPIEKRSKDDDNFDEENESDEMLIDQPPTKKNADLEVEIVLETRPAAKSTKKERWHTDDEKDDHQAEEEVVTEFHFDNEVNGDEKEQQNATELDGQQSEIIEEIEQKPIKFNEELYCKHGKLSNKKKRAWLTEDEWNKLKSSFIDYCEPIACKTQECLQCVEEREIINLLRHNSLDQLQALQNDIKMLLNKIAARRPGELKIVGNDHYTHVICKEFVTKMRNNNRTRQKVVEIPPICQNCLLCNHGRPYLPLRNENDREAALNLFPIFNQTRTRNGNEHAEGIPIFDWEWRELVTAYKRHAPEQQRPIAILLQDNGHQYVDFCDNCFLEYMHDEEMKRYIYPEGANIFVKLRQDEENGQSAGASTSLSRTATMTTRRCTQKNLLKAKMRSDQTVLDLKMELMKQIGQSPFDQLLYLGEDVLDNDLTLEASRVAANNQDNPLILILQQHVDNNDSLGTNGAEGPAGPRQPEKGFKDTALA